MVLQIIGDLSMLDFIYYQRKQLMENNNRVFVTSGNGPFNNAKDALLQLNPDQISGKTILIKPNMGRMTGPEKGINTHPQAVAGVIEALQEMGAASIAIGESPILGVNTMQAFERSGIKEVADTYSCPVIDFDAVPPITKKVPNGRILEETKICAPVFEYDLVLSLPVSKCHMHTGVTLGLKNMKGCLYRREKVRYHQLEYKTENEFTEKTLDTAISDLGTILLPDITVVDGYLGLEGLGPSGGDPILSDFSVASYNPVGADVIACAMMGLSALEVPHIRLIAERMGFDINASDYEVIPADYAKNMVCYRKPPTDIGIEYPDVKLCDKESCSACLSTAMLFLKRFKNDMGPYALDDGQLHLAIGKGITEDEIRQGTILIGNCARNVADKGIFVSGCPPVPTRIYEAITGEEPETNEPELE